MGAAAPATDNIAPPLGIGERFRGCLVGLLERLLLGLFDGVVPNDLKKNSFIHETVGGAEPEPKIVR